uniref:Nuclear condensin complex subunit 3 C-terminal domain-containing protein n=1 Tax=Anopheles atroparvus TaxID=41427 RepID=A0AAG5D889_ANOAO
MAPRKRKVVVAAPVASPEKVKFSTAVVQTMLNAQQKETTHAKLINQLKQLYATVPHDSFMKSFIQVVKRQMEREEANEYANNVLKFCAKFVAQPEYSEQSITHPVMATIFDWLLSTISSAPLVRFRICQLVNLILNALGSDATLDDTICDKILRYMLERMRDVSQQVRVQAVLALQRLQDPSSPEDSVVRAYTYHLDKDPSSKVRQTIISCLGRNYRSIPHILERLWDADERVRRHTYMQMSSYPVRQYKVAQRLKFLEQGLKDHSDSVRKVVRNVMIPQWIESYQRDYVAFVEALKLDADEQEMDRFRKTSKMALFEIFNKNGVKEMTELLNFSEENKTVPLVELTIESAICWQAMLEHLHKTNSHELEDYMPELSKFCEYLKELVDNPGVAAFMKCTSNTSSGSNQTSPGQADGMDKLQQLYYQYILLTLLEIAAMYDFGDEFGCDSLKMVLSEILCNETLYEMNVRTIMQTFEKLLTDVETRLKFFVDLINSVLEPSRQDVSHSSRMLVETYLEKHPEQTALKLKISSLRLEILDLKEQETQLAQQKDYAGAQSVAEKLNLCNEEYANLVKPLLHEMTMSISSTTGDTSTALGFRDTMLKPRRMTPHTINKCLQVCFYLVNSPTVRVLTPAVCDLYKSFISRHVQSVQLHTRNWALRASTAFSMLYDGLSKDTFQLLYQQFLDTASTRLWKTAIEGVFELLDRYGFEHFDLEKDDDASKDTSRTTKSSRQLFNRHSTGYPDDSQSSSSTCNGNEFYKMSIHFMDTCDDDVICLTIIEGFCRLILHGHCTSSDIVSKLLLRFFNPTTDSRTQQVLGIFFEALIRKKRQELLQKALLRTLFTVLEAPNESPLAEVQPETVVKFVINSTRPVFCSPGVNPHNTIAVTFLRVMHDNLTLKDLLKILSRQLLVLEITDDTVLRGDLVSAVNGILQESTLDPKMVKALTTFREMMLGKIAEPLSFSSSRAPASATMTETGDDNGGEKRATGGERESTSAAAEDEDDEEDEQEQEEEENELELNRTRDRPQINKSILQEDSDAELLTSPMKVGESVPAQAPGTPSSLTPMTTPPPSERTNALLKSLRRSLCFGSCPPPAEQVSRLANPTTTTTSSGGTFKVPDASALRKIRATSARAKERTAPSVAKDREEEFEIPATQEDDAEGDAEQEDDSDVEIPETQTTPSERKSGGRRTSARRIPAASRGKNSKRSDSATSSGSSSSTTTDEDVVNGSPNVTVSRINRSVRPLNKVAAKTLYERSVMGPPGTMPRVTRHVSRLDAINGKVMTRKSLSVLGDSASSPQAASSSSSRRTKDDSKQVPRTGGRTSRSAASNQSNISSPTTARTPKSSSTQGQQKSTKTATVDDNAARQTNAPERRRSSSRRSKKADDQSPSPRRISSAVPATSTPNQPKTPTVRTSARTAATTSSPGGKRSRNRNPPAAADANKSTDSGTSTTSPIRLKRAAVVLTPLSATVSRVKLLERDGKNLRSTPTSPRRPNRKAARK